MSGLEYKLVSEWGIESGRGQTPRTSLPEYNSEANPDTPRAASSHASRVFCNVFQKISNEESPSLSIPRRRGATIWIADPVTNPPTTGVGVNSTNQPNFEAPNHNVLEKKSDEKGTYTSKPE